MTHVAICPEHLNLISICTGGFGLDLGVELAISSARTVCMVEREAFAVAQLVSAMEEGHMAPAPIWSDARTFNGRAWRGAVDGLIGGIPCQPHSLAGRKGGQNDERDLWSDARRIIVQSRARFVLIENVSGMLSAGSDEIAGAERVCRDLHKLGFAVEGGLFTAAEVGAPHQRERVFILAVADPDRRQQPRRSTGPREEVGRRAYAQSPGSGSGGCGALVYAERSEWRPHAVSRHEPNGEDCRWSEASSWIGEPSELVDDTSIARGGPISIQPRRQGKACADLDGASAGYGSVSNLQHLADANGDEQAALGRNAREVPHASERESWAEYGSALSGRLGLPAFPPGPGDADGWRHILSRAPELEPAFRRVADGLATRMDIARVDRLRMLGNGVVPLEAAYALRTLITRLAARGSAGAARLVRMMEGIEA
ncbi:DNA cytosine methyltransferase [Agrobacterium rubi]|nr:DNA cytosine methyltransferase [Agrobacterium rubi]NTF03157.1 DNA cytosine methyltransferase [Agrobacterium rubi]